MIRAFFHGGPIGGTKQALPSLERKYRVPTYELPNFETDAGLNISEVVYTLTDFIEETNTAHYSSPLSPPPDDARRFAFLKFLSMQPPARIR